MSNPLNESHLLDSDEFCQVLRLPARIYEGGIEPPDNPKVIIQHSNMDYVNKVAEILGKEEFSQIENSHIGSIVKLARRTNVQFSTDLFHFLMQRRVLTKGNDLWFTFSDQPMRFSLREFYLTTGIACEEDQAETEPLFRRVKKPYLWMLSKGDKYTVKNLYDKLEIMATQMTRLERLSLGVAIITEGVIIAEHTSCLIPKNRMLAYMNYDQFSKMAWGKTAYEVLSNSVRSLTANSWRGESYEVRGFLLAINLWALSSVNVLGKYLGNPCGTTSSSDPLCLRWESTTTSTITEVLELEKTKNIVVNTVFGLPEEYKHLVEPIHPDDMDFDSVVHLVRQGYIMKKSDWEQGFVDFFDATEDVGQQQWKRNKNVENEEDLDNREAEEHGEDVEHEEDVDNREVEEDNQAEEREKVEEYKQAEEGKKAAKENKKAEGKKEDEDHSKSNSGKLDKLIQMVHNLGKRVECIKKVLGIKEHDVSSNEQDYENVANSRDRRSEPVHGNDEDTFNQKANSGDRGNASDGEKAVSDTQDIMEEIILGENENTQKITQDEETEKTQEQSCMKQASQVTSSSPKFTTPNIGSKVSTPTPTFATPKFDLLSQESRNSGKIADEVLLGGGCHKSVSEPLMKKKKRMFQQDEQVNDDVELPLEKKRKAAALDNIELRRSQRGQIPSILTQPPFTGARKKHPIVHPFEPVDKGRKEKMNQWKISNKYKKLIINNERVNAKWLSDLETAGRRLSKTHMEAGLELLKTRKRDNPDLFLNKTALVVGLKFLEEIDELYDEFLDDKEGFKFDGGFDKFNIEKNISFLYSAIVVEDQHWLGIVVNLEKRSITAFNCAALKNTDEIVSSYVNAYAVVLPFMIRYINKDINMDTSKFAINVVSKGLPQVLKIQDSGVYALTLIECHAMRIVDYRKLCLENIANIREKLAVDIFSELQ